MTPFPSSSSVPGWGMPSVGDPCASWFRSPNASIVWLSGSERSGKRMPRSRANALRISGESGLIAASSMPAAWISARFVCSSTSCCLQKGHQSADR